MTDAIQVVRDLAIILIAALGSVLAAKLLLGW